MRGQERKVGGLMLFVVCDRKEDEAAGINGWHLQVLVQLPRQVLEEVTPDARRGTLRTHFQHPAWITSIPPTNHSTQSSPECRLHPCPLGCSNHHEPGVRLQSAATPCACSVSHKLAWALGSTKRGAASWRRTHRFVCRQPSVRVNSLASLLTCCVVWMPPDASTLLPLLGVAR